MILKNIQPAKLSKKDEESEDVCWTSPGCISFMFFIDLTPNEDSNNWMKLKRLVGLLLPTLKILWGAKDVEGSGWLSRKLKFG